MRTITSISLAVLTGIAVHAQNERSSIHFASGSAALTEDAIRALAELCEQAGSLTPGAVLISGHTDNVGSAAYNRDLSQRRAEAVRAQLVSTCTALASARIEWRGESTPVADNEDAAGRADNRRVEVSLTLDDPRSAARMDAAVAPVVPRAHAHPRVERLLPVADKPQEVHQVDASRPIDLTAKDGTRVRIAANCLVNAAGEPVTGMVDISYRSFIDPYEIIASGIPMHVRTEEGTEHLETAGMYEIYASQNGEPVRLKEGGRIDLERPEGEAPTADFTGWKLNEASGAWTAGGTITRPPSADTPAAAATVALATKATTAYWNELRRLVREPRPDTTLFDARRASGDYCHFIPCDTTTPRKVGWVQRRDRFEHIPGVPEITVHGYQGSYEPDNIMFVIKIGNDRQFPAWRRLPHDVAFRYIGPESRALFKRLYGRRHVFQDIDLVMEPGNEAGVLRLKENGEWLDLRVSTGLNRTTAARQARWDAAVEKYAKAMAKQRLQFDRDITRKHKRYQREHVNEHLQAWRKAQAAMTEEERAIASEQWREYALPRQPRLIQWTPMDPAVSDALAQVRTTFGLESFGIYNIDRIMKMTSQQNVMASTIDENGSPFPWVAAYAVLTSERSVITYWGDGRGVADNMLVSPGRMKSVFLVDAKGNVATAEVEPLNAHLPMAVLRVKPLDKSADIDALRATASR